MRRRSRRTRRVPMRVNAFQAKESRGNLVANTDQLALLGIAKTLLSRRARPSGEASPGQPVYADLRELTRCRRSQIREQTATANRIHTIVDQLCPGFLDASKSGLTPFCAASLELMKDRFSAPELARRKPPALAKLLRRHHGAEAWNPSSVSTRGVPPPVPSRPLSPARPARPRRPRISRPAKKPQRPGPADHAQKPASKKVKNIICIDLRLLTPNTDRNHRRCCIVKRSMTFPGLSLGWSPISRSAGRCASGDRRWTRRWNGCGWGPRRNPISTRSCRQSAKRTTQVTAILATLRALGLIT